MFARPITRRLALAAAAVALGLTAWSLVAMSIDRTEDAAAGRQNLRDLTPFWIASALAWTALLVVWRTLRPEAAHAADTRHRSGSATLVVLAVAAVARVIVLAGHTPALSDDVYRYAFDGRNAAHGHNPYLVVPEPRRTAAEERYPGERALAERVNNEELTTIYLPASQLAFRAAATVLGDRDVEPDAATRVFRAAFVSIELAAMALLAFVLRRADRSPWWLTLYAWHPLPLAEIAGAGHQDVIGIALLLLGLAIAQARPNAIARWTIPLAVAVLVKPIVVPAAPLLLRGRRFRDYLVSGAVGLLVVAALAGPMLLSHGGAPLDNLGDTVSRFTLKWAHFGSVYEPLLAAIETAAPAWSNDAQEQLARGICAALLGLVIVVVWLRGRDAWRDASGIFLAMVLLSPAAHPWYLLWALALLPVARNPAVWVATLTLPWGYAVLGDTVEWTVPPWVMVVAYVPIYATLLAEPLRSPLR